MSANFEERIRATEAAYISPNRAGDWLLRFVDTHSFNRRFPYEIVLMRRNSPQIDLALARFGRDPRVICRVFKRGSIGIRCAALVNHYTGTALSRGWRGWLSANDFTLLIKRGKTAELRACLSNEVIDAEILQALFRKAGIFSEISEDRWQLCIQFITDNPRLNGYYTGETHSFAGGYAEYLHDAWAEDAWKLSLNVPTDEAWKNILTRLYSFQIPRSIKKDWVQPSLERWNSAEGAECLRSLIADNIQDRESCRGSGDRALRMSYYRTTWKMSPEEMQNFYDTDKTAFLDCALDNERVFIIENSREKLMNLCEAEKDDTYEILFSATYKKFRNKYPETQPMYDNQELYEIRELRAEIILLREILESYISQNEKIKTNVHTLLDQGGS